MVRVEIKERVVREGGREVRVEMTRDGRKG